MSRDPATRRYAEGRRVRDEVESISADDATINATHTAPETKEPPGRTGATAPYLSVGEAYNEAALDIVGTRQNAWTRPLVGYQDVAVSATSYTAVTPPQTFAALESPPGKVPVIRYWLSFGSDTAGETMSVRINTVRRQSDGAPPLFDYTTGTGTQVQRVYAERYLNEIQFGTGDKNDMTEAAFTIEAQVSGGSGTVEGRSMLAMDYEVI